ncbi:restriction endonuclease [Patescibacteria group bacterium]|nr:restriction endonuclease [Patescibacteria group bacterium]
MDYVIKANGERELFNEDKLRFSIKRAGIQESLEEKVVNNIKSKLYNNIPTSEIYSQILNSLGNSHVPYRSRYGLKQAVMHLGPTGFPFEDFISEILKDQGYETEVGSILEGRCVKHEVDVIAEKQGKKIMVEAKFHNAPGTKTDLHVSLYTKARFDDIKNQHSIDEAWIVTNTKATLSAVSYALCNGMKVISWSFPQNESLRDLIEKTGVHPITQISSLSHAQKQILMENHIVLSRDILKNKSLLDILNIQEDRRKEILDEIAFVCNLKS